MWIMRGRDRFGQNEEERFSVVLEEKMAVEAGFDDAQEELDSLQLDLPPEARDAVADLVRALFSVGASPVEAKAVLTEVLSTPIG